MKKDPLQIAKLIEETQKGNTKAFGEVYDLFFVEIHKYVYYKVSSDQVEDLVSGIFFKAWTKIHQYHKAECPFGAWLYRIAHNTVIDHYRTHRQFYELEEKIADEESMNPELYTEKKLNSQRVHRAVRKLGKPYQDVILLKFMNNLSNQDIAKTLATSENNVRTLQFRGLKKLKEILEDQEKRALENVKQPQKSAGKIPLLKRIFARSP